MTHFCRVRVALARPPSAVADPISLRSSPRPPTISPFKTPTPPATRPTRSARTRCWRSSSRSRRRTRRFSPTRFGSSSSRKRLGLRRSARGRRNARRRRSAGGRRSGGLAEVEITIATAASALGGRAAAAATTIGGTGIAVDGTRGSGVGAQGGAGTSTIRGIAIVRPGTTTVTVIASRHPHRTTTAETALLSRTGTGPRLLTFGMLLLTEVPTGTPAIPATRLLLGATNVPGQPTSMGPLPRTRVLRLLLLHARRVPLVATVRRRQMVVGSP